MAKASKSAKKPPMMHKMPDGHMMSDAQMRKQMKGKPMKGKK